MQTTQQPLFEQYRPSTWSDVIAQDKAIAKINLVRKRGLTGRGFWISGKSGTGKTTIARILAAEVAADIETTEIDATALNADKLRDIEATIAHTSLFPPYGRAYIVNEAHGLCKASIRRLLCLTEPIPPHVIWIFTTTCDGQQSLFEDQEDAGPLLSRFVRLSLSSRGLAEAFAARCREIAEAEGLNGKPIERYLALAKDCRNNFRAMLQAIEAGAMMDL